MIVRLMKIQVAREGRGSFRQFPNEKLVLRKANIKSPFRLMLIIRSVMPVELTLRLKSLPIDQIVENPIDQNFLIECATQSGFPSLTVDIDHVCSNIIISVYNQPWPWPGN